MLSAADRRGEIVLPNFSAARAARSLSRTFSTRFVFSPPRQIRTAATMPHKKAPGMSIPVDQAGLSKLEYY